MPSLTNNLKSQLINEVANIHQVASIHATIGNAPDYVQAVTTLKFLYCRLKRCHTQEHAMEVLTREYYYNHPHLKYQIQHLIWLVHNTD